MIHGVGNYVRVAMYGRLAQSMELSIEECHIGMFDVARCQQVEIVMEEWEGDPERIAERDRLIAEARAHRAQKKSRYQRQADDESGRSG